MYINLETAKKLVDYQSLERENKHLKSEIELYKKIIRKYEFELLKIEKEEERKNGREKTNTK